MKASGTLEAFGDRYLSYPLMTMLDNRDVMKKQKQAEARILRSAGMSLNKIANILKVSKSSVSIWVRDIKISTTDTLKKKKDIPICKFCSNRCSKSRNKYCSFKCYAQDKKHNYFTKCLNCNSEIKSKIYCSPGCYLEYGWKLKIEKAERTGLAPAHQSTAKILIIKMRGHVCSICSGREWCGKPIPLVLDHVNGRSSDWQLLNLRLVCGNCDMQLPTYKSKNKGNGRVYDRLYKQKQLTRID